MNLEIITPDKSIFKGKVSSIKIPGELSSFEILNNHAPIISTLVEGKISIKIEKKTFIHIDYENKINNNTLCFNIESGIIKNDKKNIQILLN